MTTEEYGALKRLIEEKSAEDAKRFALADGRFKKIDAQFDKVDQRFDEMRTEIRAAAVETRRHFDVVAEDLETSIKVITEGYENHTKVLADHEGRLVRLEQARLRFDG